MFDCVLLMAGSGKRSLLNKNKVFFEVNNKPLYKYALDEFLKIEECKSIVLVIQKGEEKYISDINHPKVKITYGGKERQDSVYQGVICCDSPLVFIHDGARANIRKKDIFALYEVAKNSEACLLATKMKNTVKKVIDGRVVETVDRSILWEAQTPQAVRKDQYISSYDKAIKEGFVATDDVELVKKYFDIDVRIVEGDSSNIKVTTPLDLEIIQKLLKEE